MTIDNLIDEIEVDTTARIEIHPGYGTDSSISVSLCTNGETFGTLTLGDNLIHWTAPDASAISFSPQDAPIDSDTISTFLKENSHLRGDPANSVGKQQPRA
jgi:hypothetical protein